MCLNDCICNGHDCYALASLIATVHWFPWSFKLHAPSNQVKGLAESSQSSCLLTIRLHRLFRLHAAQSMCLISCGSLRQLHSILRELLTLDRKNSAPAKHSTSRFPLLSLLLCMTLFCSQVTLLSGPAVTSQYNKLSSKGHYIFCSRQSCPLLLLHCSKAVISCQPLLMTSIVQHMCLTQRAQQLQNTFDGGRLRSRENSLTSDKGNLPTMYIRFYHLTNVYMYTLTFPKVWHCVGFWVTAPWPFILNASSQLSPFSGTINVLYSSILMFLPTFLSAEWHEESILRQGEQPCKCAYTPVEAQHGSSLLQRHDLEPAQEASARL